MTKSPHEDWISAYVDDELSSEERQQAEERIGRDPELQAQVAELRQLGDRLRNLPTHRLSASFAAQIREAAVALNHDGQPRPAADSKVTVELTPRRSWTSRLVAVGVVGTLAATLLVSLTLPAFLPRRMTVDSVAMNASSDTSEEFVDHMGAIESEALDSGTPFGGRQLGGNDSSVSDGDSKSRILMSSRAGLLAEQGKQGEATGEPMAFGGGNLPESESAFPIQPNNPIAASAQPGSGPRAGSALDRSRGGDLTSSANAEPVSGSGTGIHNLAEGKLEGRGLGFADKLGMIAEAGKKLDGATADALPMEVVAAVYFKQPEPLTQLNVALSRHRFHYAEEAAEGVLSVMSGDDESRSRFQVGESDGIKQPGEDSLNSIGDPAPVTVAQNEPAAGGQSAAAPAGGLGGFGPGGFGGGGAVAGGGEPAGAGVPEPASSALPPIVLRQLQSQSEPILLEMEGTVEQLDGLLGELAQTSQVRFYRYSVAELGVNRESGGNADEDSAESSGAQLKPLPIPRSTPFQAGEQESRPDSIAQRLDEGGESVGVARRSDRDSGVARPTGIGPTARGIEDAPAADPLVTSGQANRETADFGTVRLTPPTRVLQQMFEGEVLRSKIQSDDPLHRVEAATPAVNGLSLSDRTLGPAIPATGVLDRNRVVEERVVEDSVVEDSAVEDSAVDGRVNAVEDEVAGNPLSAAKQARTLQSPSHRRLRLYLLLVPDPGPLSEPPRIEVEPPK